MFADDTTVLTADNSPSGAAKKCKEQLENYRYSFAAHGLLLNEKKTNLTVFPRCINQPDVTLGDEKIIPCGSAKFLGIHVDEDLNWNNHVKELIGKLNGSLFVIRRLSVVCPHDVALQAFHSLLMSQINYCILAWGGTSARNLTSILKLQKRGIRYIQRIGPRDSCRAHFSRLKILTAPSLYILRCIMHVTRKEVWDSLLINGETHPYPTRQRGNPLRPSTRSARGERLDPTYQGLTFFNALPQQLKIARGAKNFERLLKHYLIEKAFYATHELSV